MRVTKDPDPLQHLRLLLASRKGCDFKPRGLVPASASVTTHLGCGGEFVPGSRSGDHPLLQRPAALPAGQTCSAGTALGWHSRPSEF